MSAVAGSCERCGRLVVDGTTDFGIGGPGREFVLAPSCNGILVRVGKESLGFVSADELREFLRRAYGDPAERMGRELVALRLWALHALDGGRNAALEHVVSAVDVALGDE